MDNKLSELSKQVAWTWNAYGMQHATTEEDESAELILDGVDVNPLYSQEYVSALLAELERKNKYWNSAEDELERAKQRIAELEAKLATPVRLPEGTGWASDPYNHGRNSGINECAGAIRAAGFTVEGDK